jgi:hypothetical protein
LLPCRRCISSPNLAHSATFIHSLAAPYYLHEAVLFPSRTTHNTGTTCFVLSSN